MPDPEPQAGRSAVYADFRETVEIGLANDIPRDAQLFLLGRIFFASERGDISIEQAEELQKLLGFGPLGEIMEFAVYGDVDKAA